MKKFFTFIAVAAMALGAQATELTVCDGTDTNGNVPIFSGYTDYNGTLSQMIYTPALVEEMKGCKISQVKFYSPQIYFSGVTLQLSVMDGVEQDNFAEYNYITDMMAVAEANPNVGDTELVFNLPQPFTYEGGNLVLEVKVIVTADWSLTKYYGMEMDYVASYFQYISSDGRHYWNTKFLPKTTFIYEPAGEPTEKTLDPALTVTPGNQQVIVTAANHAYEPDGVLYISIDGSDFAVYTGPVTISTMGEHTVTVNAQAPGKAKSNNVTATFTVDENTKPDLTGVDELSGDKAITGVRYFNVAGQEMQQPSGLTIVVTTYSDGTTTAVKVVK